MTVKQLIRKLQNPPCKRIAAVRIEFADGGVYEDSPDTRHAKQKPRGPNGASAALACRSDITYLIIRP
jgi:hypothetical protein